MVLTRSLPLGTTLATRTEKNIDNGRKGVGFGEGSWGRHSQKGEKGLDVTEKSRKTLAR